MIVKNSFSGIFQTYKKTNDEIIPTFKTFYVLQNGSNPCGALDPSNDFTKPLYFIGVTELPQLGNTVFEDTNTVPWTVFNSMAIPLTSGYKMNNNEMLVTNNLGVRINPPCE